MITGTTQVIAHLGYPTETFKAPMIYNPWFEARSIDAVVVPLGVKAQTYARFLPALFELSNVRGALVTMPHKISTVTLLGACSTAVKVAGSCNAVRRRDDGVLEGDMFDGEGFVRGVRRKGVTLAGATCLLVGCGGVGSAIAASLAAAGVGSIALVDPDINTRVSLAARLQQHYPRLNVSVGTNDPAGFDLAVNATPLGMQPGDPLPFDVDRLSPRTFVGEVVMKQAMTPLLQAAQRIGCPFQIGTDMLFEQIPAYLEFFGFGVASVDELRALAKVRY